LTTDLLFLTREIRIYYPYPQDFPEALLELAGLPEPLIEAARVEPLLRIAKHRDRAIGVYVLVNDGAERFRITALAVLPEFRSKGLASWLVGHALGVAETKGAREVVCVANAAVNRLLPRLGFVEQASDWQLEILPE
jgi:GNAT superfamily N-acetyltransferase